MMRFHCVITLLFGQMLKFLFGGTKGNEATSWHPRSSLPFPSESQVYDVLLDQLTITHHTTDPPSSLSSTSTTASTTTATRRAVLPSQICSLIASYSHTPVWLVMGTPSSSNINEPVIIYQLWDPLPLGGSNIATNEPSGDQIGLPRDSVENHRWGSYWFHSWHSSPIQRAPVVVYRDTIYYMTDDESYDDSRRDNKATPTSKTGTCYGMALRRGAPHIDIPVASGGVNKHLIKSHPSDKWVHDALPSGRLIVSVKGHEYPLRNASSVVTNKGVWLVIGGRILSNTLGYTTQTFRYDLSDRPHHVPPLSSITGSGPTSLELHRSHNGGHKPQQQQQHDTKCESDTFNNPKGKKKPIGWQSAGDMVYARRGAAIVADPISGYVYAFGGFPATPSISSTNGVSSSLSSTSSSPTSTTSSSCIEDKLPSSRTCERWDPSANTWTLMHQSLPESRSYAIALYVPSLGIVIAGGSEFIEGTLPSPPRDYRSALLYDTLNDSYRQLKWRLPMTRISAVTAASDGSLLAWSSVYRPSTDPSEPGDFHCYTCYLHADVVCERISPDHYTKGIGGIGDRQNGGHTDGPWQLLSKPMGAGATHVLGSWLV
jgi:hypothetical protein